jgi:hypothetical protein
MKYLAVFTLESTVIYRTILKKEERAFAVSLHLVYDYRTIAHSSINSLTDHMAAPEGKACEFF